MPNNSAVERSGIYEMKIMLKWISTFAHILRSFFLLDYCTNTGSLKSVDIYKFESTHSWYKHKVTNHSKTFCVQYYTEDKSSRIRTVPFSERLMFTLYVYNHSYGIHHKAVTHFRIYNVYTKQTPGFIPLRCVCSICLMAMIYNIRFRSYHESDVIISAMASKSTSLASVYSTVYSGADKKKHQSTASLP